MIAWPWHLCCTIFQNKSELEPCQSWYFPTRMIPKWHYMHCFAGLLTIIVCEILFCLFMFFFWSLFPTSFDWGLSPPSRRKGEKQWRFMGLYIAQLVWMFLYTSIPEWILRLAFNYLGIWSVFFMCSLHLRKVQYVRLPINQRETLWWLRNGC